MTTDARVTVMTANAAGAIAIIQVVGPDAAALVSQLTGNEHWQPARVRLVDFSNIDQGVTVMLPSPSGHHVFQLMPHGGTRVVQRIVDWLASHGATIDEQAPAQTLYPEAASPMEADMLAAIARAASPLAIDLLAVQPAAWRAAIHQPDALDGDAIAQRSAILDRLITPPTVVVVGQANVGKSTLTNRLLGRAASIVADLPGTTRDWVAGLAELSLDDDPQHTVALRWLDTPGLRESDDAVEQRAIQLARQVIAEADLIIAMRDADRPWPNADNLPRQPDLWVMNKTDTRLPEHAGDGHAASAPLPISARSGQGIDTFENAVLTALDLADLFTPATVSLWAFSQTLKSSLRPSLKLGAIKTYLAEI